MLVLVRVLPIYSERWWACQKSYGVRMGIRTRMRNMTNLTYMVIAFNMIQSKVPFQILLHNSLAIIISFIASFYWNVLLQAWTLILSCVSSKSLDFVIVITAKARGKLNLVVAIHSAPLYDSIVVL